MPKFQVVLLTVLISLFVWISHFATPFGTYLDSCAKKAVKNERTRIEDLRIQRDFFSVYYLAFFSCQLLRVLGRNKCSLRHSALGLFTVATEAIISHLFRYVIYVLIVNPWGKSLPWENVCYPDGTKSISGHTHMYAFHCVLLCYFYMTRTCSKKVSVRGVKRQYSIFSMFFDAVSCFLVLYSTYLSIFSIWKTYSGGYHSIRDIVLGGLFGIFSVFAYLLCRTNVLKLTGKVKERNTHD